MHVAAARTPINASRWSIRLSALVSVTWRVIVCSYARMIPAMITSKARAIVAFSAVIRVPKIKCRAKGP